MEETTVLVVGAGPSGLVLGALLARMNIKVVILEKDQEVCEDPRGIVVNGDAVRISYQVGIGEGLTKRIGHNIGTLYFHKGNFRQRPFMKFDLLTDWAEHSVSQNITQFQPNYEREIQSLIKSLPLCELRTGCEVLSRNEEKRTTVVEYRTHEGENKTICTSWLVGADGKRGVVRKRFLEPEGIKQQDAIWPYVGTWVAINLEITTPTPKSHPDFPLWRLGYTPPKVYDAFWPKGFHFCNDPRRPAVSGRFGPKGAQYWRHEYSVEPEDECEDVEADFWNHFTSWMIIPGLKFSSKLNGTNVEFPRDCIRVLRCRPFRFATKVVNRWFCRRTMLIGDAAHVFPPFGGQGIATGIRDAQALGWRLAMMSRLHVPPTVEERVLRGWSQERRHAWEAATKSTQLNGTIVNQRSFWRGFLYRVCMRILWSLPGGARWRTHWAFRDKLVYNTRTCHDGFFLESAGGGRKVAQIWVRQTGEKPRLSDEVFFQNLSHLSILVLVKKPSDLDPVGIADMLKASDLPDQILTMDDVSYLDVSGRMELIKHDSQTYFPCSKEYLKKQDIVPINGYNEAAIQNRLASSAMYVIIRPDFFIHSVATDLPTLRENLSKVKEYFCEKI